MNQYPHCAYCYMEKHNEGRVCGRPPSTDCDKHLLESYKLFKDHDYILRDKPVLDMLKEECEKRGLL